MDSPRLVSPPCNASPTPPLLPPRPRRQSSPCSFERTPPPLPSRPRNPLYPSSPGPRLPSTFALVRQTANAARTRATPPSSYRLPGVKPRSASLADMSDGTPDDEKPIDIRARVAAFENFGGAASQPRPVPGKRLTPAPPPPPPRSASPAYTHRNASTSSFSGGQDISRVSSTPRSRPGDEPAPQNESHPDPLAEFGALSPQMRFGGRNAVSHNRLSGSPSVSPLPPPSSASLPSSSSNPALYSSSPHASASLSPVSAHRLPSALHTVGSGSPGSTFDLYASSAGVVRRQASGTSLRDFTNASLARAAHQSSRGSSPGMSSEPFASAGSISGKVPLPVSSLSRRGSPSPSRATSSTSLGRSDSPHPPPPPSRNLASALYARTSASQPHLGPGSPVRQHAHHRSSISSSSSSSTSVSRTHPLDDDDADQQGGGYGLSLHPALQPTASPVSSRAPSRASMSRSAPGSPKLSPTEGAGLAAPASTQLRLHPPTPSPERRPVDSPRGRSIDNTDRSGAPMYAVRKKGPALPPRSGIASSSTNDAGTNDPASQSGAYAPYNPARRSSAGSVTSGNQTVASKVPLPPGHVPPSSSPSLHRATPAPAPLVPPRPGAITTRARHATSHSTGSSPADSPLPSPAAGGFGHRVTKSGPGPSGSGPTALQPPPMRNVGAMNRTRSSSMGPSNDDANSRLASPSRGASGGYKQSPSSPSPNVFHGNRAYQTAALARSSKAFAQKTSPRQQERLPPRPTAPTSRSLEPTDVPARKRYEALWDLEIERATRVRKEKQAKKGKSSTVRRTNPGVASLAQRFEGAGVKDTTVSTTSLASASLTRLPPKQVGKIWSRSHLRSSFLSEIWEAAVQYERDHQEQSLLTNDKDDDHHNTRGLGRESFVRGLAAIDAELEYRREKRKWKEERRRVRAGIITASPGVGRSVSAGTTTSHVHRRVAPPA